MCSFVFTDKMVEFRVVIGSPDEVHQMFVAGEDQSFIESEGHDLITGLVDLICCYYAYRVAYPENMEGCLLFLQEIEMKMYIEVQNTLPSRKKYVKQCSKQFRH